MNQQQEEQELITRILSGEVRLYTVLVERYGNMVFTLVARVLKNSELCEETAQDIFVKAFESLSSFDGRSKFSTWLYKISYHRALDVLKREKRQISMDSLSFNHQYIPVEQETIWEELKREERSAILKETLDLLPPEESSLLILYYLDEQSLKEIAEVMGLSVNVIKVRLFRARNKFREVMETTRPGQILKNYGS